MGLSRILAASILALGLLSAPGLSCPEPAPVPQGITEGAADSSYWMSSIKRQGVAAFSTKSGYKVFRNVKDFGAKGDGKTDDTVAINNAITDGGRCGLGCDSSTTTPAIVYFPPGTYVVSKPIIAYYYSQLVGDAVKVPTLKAASNFQGIAVIDADPYDNRGNNWYTNQNNFFRQVRNFKIDLTGMPKSAGTGIHWQVAQATSLQNIEFNMVNDKSDANKQQGIFMENGSGGFMTDLVFNGGRYGAWFGNQQFTVRNLKFNNCNTAIYLNWNWVWTFHGLSINNCDIGIDMAQTAGASQLVGTVILMDSVISDTSVGVATNYDVAQRGSNGTLFLDNVDMRRNVKVAVQHKGSKKAVLNGNTLIASWSQGRSYTGTSGKPSQGPRSKVSRPQALTDEKGRIFARSKPTYKEIPASKFVSVKSKGAKGDGKADDTAAIQAVFDKIGADEVVYFDHGAYVITDTVRVPKNVKVVGEIWPLIMAGGNKAFKDEKNPKPVFQVGQKGDVGNVEIQELMFETLGPQPGAILMEVNVAGSSKGSAALFDVHFRVGGSAGTQLQSDKCSKTPKVKTDPNPECVGAFMLMHITSSASIYMENIWAWVADHELDRSDFNQVNIYNGRGILIESTKGAWLWGTASEHSVLSNYQVTKAKNLFMGLIQTETAYFQGNPEAPRPFTVMPKYSDPDFTSCKSARCARTWGLRIKDSSDIYLYGGGLYSFFDNYKQQCVPENNCQDNMIAVDNSSVGLFGVSTKASVAMVTYNGKTAALDSDNRSTFCGGIAAFEATS